MSAGAPLTTFAAAWCGQLMIAKLPQCFSLLSIHTLELGVFHPMDCMDDGEEIVELGTTLQSFPQLTALRVGFSCGGVHEDDHRARVALQVMNESTWRFPRLLHLKLDSTSSGCLCVLPKIHAPQLTQLQIRGTSDLARARQIALQASALTALEVIITHHLGDASWKSEMLGQSLEFWRDVQSDKWPHLKACSWEDEVEWQDADQDGSLNNIRERELHTLRHVVMTTHKSVDFDVSLDDLCRLNLS